MQFITMVLGSSGNAVLTTLLALGFVLVLIVLGLWVLKAGMRGTGTLARGRGRRLTVVDQMQIDPRRQIVIVRRDDVEHVLLLGGAQDLVIESGIAAEPARRPQPVAQADPQATVAAPMPPRPTEVRPRIERLRDLARPTALKTWRSLRHTGLLRQTGVADNTVIPLPSAAGDNPARPAGDSATRPEVHEDRRTGLAAPGDFPEQRKADGT